MFVNSWQDLTFDMLLHGCSARYLSGGFLVFFKFFKSFFYSSKIISVRVLCVSILHLQASPFIFNRRILSVGCSACREEIGA